jgi:hypothetical protein
MQLSDELADERVRMNNSQVAAVRALQRRAKMWLWARWVLLVGGIFVSAAATYWSIEVVRDLADLSSGAKDSPGVVIMLSSINASTLAELRILAALGPLLIAWAVGNWRGDPAVTVLLGLVERLGEGTSTVG